MLQLMLIILSMIISFIFIQMKHPLSMGLTLLIQTFMLCLITGFYSKTFWFSYVLFLIFMGGMLVLFIYVTTLASNEMFSLSLNLMIWTIAMIFSSSFIIMLLDLTMIQTMLMNMEMMLNESTINYLPENSLNLNKLYNFPTNMITLMMINYLFLTLIIIVKITNNFYGPLRQKN
uniref:NADH-ubiquinone oxidoreductase chain 6 n=1 Tax=Cylindrotoma sp. ZK-2016 TaxID=1808010 RepID=A0A192U5N5_9DIPT|nr:NADH dehydrogenase subunit 6 [Cylindrotoma sp. ZK-2016]